jgi:Ca-activated chloride channel homolog
MLVSSSIPKLEIMNVPTARRLAMAIAIALLAIPISGRATLHAQDARPTFRASVALVPITAVVRDGKNRVVRELRKDDFEVFEDSERRRVVDFSSTERGPVTLGVLFDTSGSMKGRNLHKGTALVSTLLDQLDGTSDEAALFTFDKAIRQETPFTNEPERIRAALEQTQSWGLTSLYDAIADTAKQVGERRGERRAVIVITDGVDTSSTLTPPDVSAIASAIDVPVYILAVEPARRVEEGSTTSASHDDALANLARWTGGDLRHVAAAEETGMAVGSLMAELRQQYFLAIESAETSGWYRLDVRTRRKGLMVRARSGYFANAMSRP